MKILRAIAIADFIIRRNKTAKGKLEKKNSEKKIKNNIEKQNNRTSKIEDKKTK